MQHSMTKCHRTYNFHHRAGSNALRISEPTPRLVLVEGGEYHLDAARFNIDVDEFDAALANARANVNDETAARWLEQATD